MKALNLAAGSTLLRAAVVLGGGVVLGGSVAACAASPGAPPPFERTRTPPQPPPLYLVDGVILQGGFHAVLGEAMADWVQRIDVVRADEARARWGEDARSGAILLAYTQTARGDAPPSGASLRKSIENHLPLLDLAHAQDPRPASLVPLLHFPGEGDPAWARAIVIIDGEILPRSRPLIRTEPLAPEPPAGWLGELGDRSARDFTLRSIRGAEAASLYGNVAWFGVIRIETRDRSGS